jgi:hypothetical protein
MIIEYDVVCFERTLTIKFPDKHEYLKEEISKALDKYYDEWQNSDPDMCLEEFMVDGICEEYDLICEEWESVPYGDDAEVRETLWVCDHCLAAIESREGNQATLTHSVDEMDAVDSRCGWCRECGFDTLYELV